MVRARLQPLSILLLLLIIVETFIQMMLVRQVNLSVNMLKRYFFNRQSNLSVILQPAYLLFTFL